MSYDLLSEPIRKYIRDKRWAQLRPIQAAAIARIMTTPDNYILASKTASGKTEAAFLPILSKVNFNEEGIQVLYISPLIALINDQFVRIEELCTYLEVPVTKWHGEANRTLKEKIIAQPSGIILITPESLEAMFVNKPFNVSQLFSDLKYIVIDEIHSFLGSDRGMQLKSILYRLQEINKGHFSIVGLSATIGDYNEAKKFTGNETQTKVLLDKSAKDIEIGIKFFKISNVTELPADLLENLYENTKESKVLIFPNSRGRAEEVAVELKKIAVRCKGHQNYFSHHSSVDREVREYVEYFVKNNTRLSFCISCTSTLELGIDIGTVDKVVQIDATHSIASLIQRVGRSGRRDDEKSNLLIYATRSWSLLQSLACWLLYKEGFIEPPAPNDHAYDILLHQLLSIVKGNSGILITDLVVKLKNNFAFKQVSEADIKFIIEHLIATGILEQIMDEVIIGLDGERVVNSREFYSVFKTEENFKVVNAGNKIGEIPLSPQVIEDANILLAAKIWKIKYIDTKAKKIEVIKAFDGKRPVFFGDGGSCHARIREKMLAILFSADEYEMLDEAAKDQLSEMRNDFSVFPVTDIEKQRPLLVTDRKLEVYTFAGSKVNRTLNFILTMAGIQNQFDDTESVFDISLSKEDFVKKWSDAKNVFTNIDLHIKNLIFENPGVMDFSKWIIYLPSELQVKLMKEKYFDFEGAEKFMENVNFIANV